MLRPQVVGRHDVNVDWDHPCNSPGLNCLPSGPRRPGRTAQMAHPRPEETHLRTKPREGSVAALLKAWLHLPRAFRAASPCDQREINGGWSAELQWPTRAAVSKCRVT